MAVSCPNENPNHIFAVNFLPRRNLVEVYAASVSLVESKNKRIPKERKRDGPPVWPVSSFLSWKRDLHAHGRAYTDRQTERERERESERETRARVARANWNRRKPLVTFPAAGRDEAATQILLRRAFIHFVRYHFVYHSRILKSPWCSVNVNRTPTRDAYVRGPISINPRDIPFFPFFFFNFPFSLLGSAKLLWPKWLFFGELARIRD